MNAINETSLTKSADPVCVFIVGALDTSSGSAPFNGLENGRSALSAEKVKQIMLHYGREGSEAQDVAPVAPHQPTNWYELAVELCHEGYITPQRRDDAIKAVRGALQ